MVIADHSEYERDTGWAGSDSMRTLTRVAGTCLSKNDGPRETGAGAEEETRCYTITPVGYTMVPMALNLKNGDVERLAAEVARLTGESKTEAIRVALEERRRRLKAVAPTERRARLLRLLRERVWPAIPKTERGRRLTQDEEDRILGYGKEGV